MGRDKEPGIVWRNKTRQISMRLKALFIVTLFVLSFLSRAMADDSQQLYGEAKQAARDGDAGRAFMSYRSLLASCPESKHRAEALFAIAEYYFLIGNFTDARPVFIQFISEYPGSKAKPFAQVYLIKIAEKQGQESLAEGLRKQIITSQQLVLLFRDYKKFQYLSPLYRRHKAVHFIDKIEFYIDGELFAQISY